MRIIASEQIRIVMLTASSMMSDKDSSTRARGGALMLRALIPALY
jgi:hypothetical protein